MKVLNPKEITEKLARIERAIFLNPIWDDGDSSTPGIDSVLAENQALTTTRTISAGERVVLFLDPTLNSEAIVLSASNGTVEDTYAETSVFVSEENSQFKSECAYDGGSETTIVGTSTGNSSQILLNTSNSSGEGSSTYLTLTTTDIVTQVSIQAGFNGEEKVASITANADTTISILEYSADTHTFSGIGGDLLNMASGLSNGQLGVFKTFGGTLAGESLLQLVNNDDDGGVHRFNLKSNAGGADVSILGDPIAQTITHTADTHTFVGGMAATISGQETFAASLTQSYIRSWNDQDDDNSAYFQTNVNDTEASFESQAIFNDGVKAVSIEGFVDATTATITHTADEHIFIGPVTTDGCVEYVATISQSSSADPVATVIKNTLGGTPTWNYISDGVYEMTLTGAFTNANIVGMYSDQWEKVISQVERVDVNTIKLEVVYYTGAGFSQPGELQGSIIIKFIP